MHTKKIKLLNDLQLQIFDEDHTLMNILVWILNNNWSNASDEKINPIPIDFCAYTIPHPSENISLLTLQFENEKDQSFDNIKKVIKNGCSIIVNICDKLLNEIYEKKG